MNSWQTINQYFDKDNREIAELFEDREQEGLRRFLVFAVKRMNVFWKKQTGEVGPWTTDQILSTHKFTNCYRVLDRVSQYLLKEVIYPWYDERTLARTEDIRELFCRIYIFKMFNKVETWERIPEDWRQDLFNNLDNLQKWAEAPNHPEPLFSNAYLMCKSTEKHNYSRATLYFTSLREMLTVPRLPESLIASDLLEDRFSQIERFYGFGRFLAYQFAMDFAYAAPMKIDFDSFVVPGPGCTRGIQKVFGQELSPERMVSVLKYISHRQVQIFGWYGIQFPYLRVNETQVGRDLNVLDSSTDILLLAVNDFQNLFCEFDKYSREAYPELETSQTRKRIKQKYSVTFAKTPQSIVLPLSWY